jgi:3,4-dihydroxy-2-butanone 4-phosphate synthase
MTALAARPESLGVGADLVARVDRATSGLSAGRPVVVVDTELENRGELIFAASKTTPELLAWVVGKTSGYVSAALTAGDCAPLAVPAPDAVDARGAGALSSFDR